MKIIRAKVLGFCFGVRRAVDLAEQALQTQNNIVISRLDRGISASKEIVGSSPTMTYSLGPLIHNEAALADLESRGLCTVQESQINTIPDGSTVIIRAHGVAPGVTAALEEKGCRIIDATCPRVKASQKMVERYTSGNDYVIITGDKNHGEMIGIAGFAGPNFVQIQNEEEARALDIPDADKINVILMSQTTYSINEFQKIREILAAKFRNITVMNTICPATSERQQALQELCSQVEGVLVIGGKTSANTRRLYQTAAENCKLVAHIQTATENCKLVAHIQTATDIPPEFFRLQTVGITAGASTPDNIIDGVEKVLKAKS